MRRRRQLRNEESNRDRWLVSYADFITLLFAFFVVMYAISSLNEGKYRVLSQSLSAIFVEAPRSERRRPRALPPGSEGRIDRVLPHAPTPEATPASDAETGSGTEADPRRDSLEQVQQRLQISLETFLDRGLVEMERHDDRIEVRMDNEMLFDSGSARLSNAVLRVLRDVGRILQPLENAIRVEGHTDDVPINTPAFPSNWELSAARAASVVHFFTRIGVPPDRLAAIGYGEHRPVADNDSEAGRARNRRVTLVIADRPQQAPPVERPVVPWSEGPNFEGNP